MFYNARAKYQISSDSKVSMYWFDLTLDEMERQLVSPLRRGCPFFHDGKVRQPSDIKDLRIMKTELPAEELRAIVRQ